MHILANTQNNLNTCTDVKLKSLDALWEVFDWLLMTLVCIFYSSHNSVVLNFCVQVINLIIISAITEEAVIYHHIVQNFLILSWMAAWCHIRPEQWHFIIFQAPKWRTLFVHKMPDRCKDHVIWVKERGWTVGQLFLGEAWAELRYFEVAFVLNEPLITGRCVLKLTSKPKFNKILSSRKPGFKTFESALAQPQLSAQCRWPFT